MLREGEPCDAGPKHRVTVLDFPGHNRLVDEVWGPPSVRRQAKNAAKAGGGGGVAGFLADACGSSGSCDVGASSCEGCAGAAEGGEALVIIGVILIAAAAAVAVYFIIAAIVRYVRKRRNRPKPKGAIDRAKRLPSRGISGVVVGENTLRSPVTGEPCAAWSLKLVNKRALGGAVMLRAAETSELEVELADGSRAFVPAGRVLLAPGRRRSEIDKRALVDYLKGIDSRYTAEPPESPVPFDRGYQSLVKAGDRVTLLGPLRPAVDPEGQHSYREAAARLEPVGVPALRVDSDI